MCEGGLAVGLFELMRVGMYLPKSLCAQVIVYGSRLVFVPLHSKWINYIYFSASCIFF